MGIFGALTTAVGGMQAQAFALQNISGNIANSQTTAFKREDTSFVDLIPDGSPTQQLSGNVLANSSSTNTVQGDIKSAAVSTYMAINGQGFFVVQKPDGQTDNKPSFTGVANYSRRGDFTLDKSGYLVNGAGYYLMGIPIDSTTGNLTGSVPTMLQFQNGFLPAQVTTQIQYNANLASIPQTQEYSSTVPGSELLNQSNFQANPVVGAVSAAKILGSGATLHPDAAATLSGSQSLTTLASAAGGTLMINGDPITINPGDDMNAVVSAINLETPTTNVTATLDGTNHLVLTGGDAITNITVGSTSTLGLLGELGLSAGTTNATNLLTQSAASQGQQLTITVGYNPPAAPTNTPLTLTFGTGVGEIHTMADLNAALAGLAGGTASADPATGNITVTAANSTDNVVIGGDATASVFGIHTPIGLPSNGTVIANDVSVFLKESVAGGAVTAYDTSGAAVNVQLRWAKTDSASQGAGHADTWNLFYQSDSTATGTESAWKNVGVNYTFGPNGQLNPAINNVTLTNMTVDGISLGDVQLQSSQGGITQFADSNGDAQVNLLSQNGFSAGALQSVAVSDKGRVVGTYSNGRSIDLAEITLANFSGADMLKRIDGGAFEETADSGGPIYGSAGTITGSSLEGSNVDIADEFTKLIVTQQAYSANTKVITTSNQMVQDLLNMLR
ncbi:MAG TPA: flagellar hook-basal body complex protein [Pseudolabrys sp.]